MKKQRGWIVLLVVAAAVAAWLFIGRDDAPVAAPSAASAKGGRSSSGIARIDLARLDAPRGKAQVGRRNLFGFGPGASARGEGEEAAPPPTLSDAPPPVTALSSPPAPPLNVKYIGNLENPEGLKVAVLLTDRREVLWGQVGDVLANRFRIVKIGLESVDIQETGSERIRRIPLRGN